MSNATAAAPASATKTPACAKAAPTPREPDPTPDWLEQGLQLTRRLSDLLYHLINNHVGGNTEGIAHELVSMAESHLFSVTDEDGHIDTSADGVLYGEINMVLTMLKAAKYSAEHGPQGYPTDLHASLIPAAIDYAQALTDALQAAPEDVGPLQALRAEPTFAGQRQFRDLPQPPVRRVDDAAQPQGLTRKQLVSVLEVAAGNLATLDQLLMLAQRTEDDFDTSAIIDAAQALARHCGGMVDAAAGEAILGGRDRWNFGPDFADLGKAGAA